ncbi:hypothetical protein [Dokdonella soli]|uniref:Uncharacterized protein n=1 Tax=Dokdonella soli TaxID=529810 RepID=A0ABP3TJZ3_9GAMM
MNRHNILVAATAMAIGFVAAMPATAQTTETTETTVTVKKGHHHYVYYGDHDIYFAPETKIYYWQQDGAWRSGEELPTASRGYVTSGGMKIDLDTEHPYERREQVIEQYKHGHDRDSGDDRDHNH